MLLALVQGITEFLPVSSSGHLVLVPSITNRSDHGLSIDVAAHIGTLIAVMIYVRSDLIKMGLALRNTALKTLRPNANILIDAPDKQRKFHKNPTPLTGGLGITIGIVFSGIFLI